MILKYSKFNEKIIIGESKTPKEGDRVICHDSVKRYREDIGDFNIDIEGQSGRIISRQGGGSCSFFGVVFDNFFSPFLDNLDNRIKMKRGMWVKDSQVEKSDDNPENKKALNMSKKLIKILDYVEPTIYAFYADDIDYVDISGNPDTITCMPLDKMDRLGYEDDQWENPYRQRVRVGRFLQLINPYSDQVTLNRKINSYKNAYNSIILNKYTFKMIEGEEIRHWYDERNYFEGAGNLNKSCMRNKLDRLNLYCENKDKVNLLIMLNEENKLMGRALIWHVDEPDVIYMDRPYTVIQEDMEAFRQYANDQGWIFYRDLHEKSYIFLNRNYGDAEENPYMDTFIIFCPVGEKGKNYLTNIGRGEENYYFYDEP